MARAIDTHRPNHVIEGRPEVVDEVAEDDSDAVRRAFRLIGGYDSIPDAAPLLNIFSDQVRLTLPEGLQLGQEVYSMVVRPIDLYPY